MNFFLKKLLLFLFFTLWTTVATATANLHEKKGTRSLFLHSKRAGRHLLAPSSGASLPVRLTWQTIRSQGEGTKLTTSAETYSQDGQIVPVGVDIWRLRISGFDIPVSANIRHKGVDGVLFFERNDLLKIFNIGLKPEWTAAEVDRPTQSGVGLILSWNQNRYMETIYRAPDEDLFLVKATIFLLKAK